MNEGQIQAEVVKYLRNVCKELVFSVPNELAGANAKVRMAQFMAKGLLPGVSDLVAVWKDGSISFVEMKDAKGRQSQHQVAFQKRVTELGHEYVVLRSLDDAKALARRHTCRIPPDDRS